MKRAVVPRRRRGAVQVLNGDEIGFGNADTSTPQKVLVPRDTPIGVRFVDRAAGHVTALPLMSLSGGSGATLFVIPRVHVQRGAPRGRRVAQSARDAAGLHPLWLTFSC